MSNTKEELVSHIKDWINCESEIKLLSKQLKEKRSRKKILTQILVDTMKSNDIDCFDINDSKLLYSSSKIRSPINKSHLLNSLAQYFKNSSEDNINNIVQHILDTRNISYKDNIRLKAPK